MATSGTFAFNPDIGELVEEAYERAGLEMRTGYDLRTARRSLNFLMLEEGSTSGLSSFMQPRLTLSKALPLTISTSIRWRYLM